MCICTTALLSIARTWKQPRCPSGDEWIRKLWYIFYFKIQVSLVLSKNTVGRHIIKFGGWWWTILIPHFKVQNIKKIIYSANMYSWEKERREKNFFKINKPVLLSGRLLLQWIFYFRFLSPHLSRLSHTLLLIPT